MVTGNRGHDSRSLHVSRYDADPHADNPPDHNLNSHNCPNMDPGSHMDANACTNLDSGSHMDASSNPRAAVAPGTNSNPAPHANSHHCAASNPYADGVPAFYSNSKTNRDIGSNPDASPIEAQSHSDPHAHSDRHAHIQVYLQTDCGSLSPIRFWYTEIGWRSRLPSLFPSHFFRCSSRRGGQ